MMPRFPLLIAALFLSATATLAAENRCGWLQNPTPGNWWLQDGDAIWTIMTQTGEEQADPGMEHIPDISVGPNYVRANGDYGYTCACLSVDTNAADERITKIYGFKQLSISKCENDPALAESK